MGVGLHIQRVGGQEADLAVVEFHEAVRLFDAIPWKDEMLAWEKIPEDQMEQHRPLYQLFDDQGHMLQITAYSDLLIGVAYNFPSPSSPFGLSYEDEDTPLKTNQFPRPETPALLECFFQHHSGNMLSLLGRYPLKQPPDRKS